MQGLGLFAARDLEKHTMVIEYIGSLIRNEVAEAREKLYEQQHRGIYMFRLTDDMGQCTPKRLSPEFTRVTILNTNCLTLTAAFKRSFRPCS